MDEELILLGLCGVFFALIVPVAMVVLGVVVYGMRMELGDMRSRIGDLEIQLSKQPLAPPAAAALTTAPRPVAAAPPTASPLQADSPLAVAAPSDATSTPRSEAAGAAETAENPPSPTAEDAIKPIEDGAKDAAPGTTDQTDAPTDSADAPESADGVEVEGGADGVETAEDAETSEAQKATDDVGGAETTETADAPDASPPPPSPDTPPQAPEPTPETPHRPAVEPIPIPQRRSLEQTLGATVAVWGGGATLGLAAILLVQYGVQNEWLGPTARLGLGLLVSLGLIIAGELVFRKLRPVGGGLVGAGIIGLYATFASAQGLYDLISPLTAGALMVLTTLMAATLSIRHKLLIIAVLGLLGGFLTPFLVGVRTGSPTGLLTYLLVLDIGVVVVATWRKWPILLVLDALLTAFAEMAWLFDNPREESIPYVLLTLLVALPTIGASLLGAGFAERPEGAESWTLGDRIDAAAQSAWGWVGLHAPILATSMVALSAAVWWKFPTSTWWMHVPLVAMAIASVGLSKHAPRSLPALACGAVIFQHWIWAMSTEPTIPAMVQISAFVGALCVIGFALLSIQRPDRELEPLAAVGAALLQYLVAFGYMFALSESSPDPEPWNRLWWAGAGGALAAGFAVVCAAQWWRHKSADRDGSPAGMAWTAMGAALFLALAAPIALDDQWLTLAWLVLTFGFVVVGQALRQNTVLAIALGVLVFVAGRLLTPWSFDQLRGGAPIFNWILILYGSAVACCLLCSWWLGRDDMIGGGTRLAIRLLGLGFFLGLLTLEIRHLFHPDLRGAFTDGENLAYSITWLLVGLGALLFGLVARSKVSRWVSLTLVMGTSLKIFLSDLSFLDGLWRVGSLAALGFLLIGIATLYRLYVFPTMDDPE